MILALRGHFSRLPETGLWSKLEFFWPNVTGSDRRGPGWVNHAYWLISLAAGPEKARIFQNGPKSEFFRVKLLQVSAHNSGHNWNFWQIPSQLEPCVKNLGCGKVLANSGRLVGCRKRKCAENAKKRWVGATFQGSQTQGCGPNLNFFGLKWRAQTDKALGGSITPIGGLVWRPGLKKREFFKTAVKANFLL